MSTKLSFEAPADLSVGTVRISGETGVVQEWIATPNNRTLDGVDTPPGFYIAEIAPAGVRSQSVIFEVKPGIANNIVLPVFTSLAADGNSPTFLNVSDRNAAVEALGKARTETRPDVSLAFEESAPRIVPKTIRSAATKKRISIALAAEVTAGKESWRPFQSPTSVELASNRLTVLVQDQESRANEAQPRVRLSLAVERVRVERLLLPMYRGGTYVALSPSQLSTSDVELEVTPVDPERRALFRALAAGTPDEAAAVKEGVLGGNRAWRFLQGTEADPWAAILASLLTLRFPDVFSRIDQNWVGALLGQAPWAYDAHVIHARSLLTSAGTDAESRRTAATCAVAALAKAQALGSPYFSYSNQLIGEMLVALGSLQHIEEKLVRRSRSLLARWQRDLPLQCESRATFKWRRRAPKKLAKGGLAPDRNASGVLGRQHGAIVFRGTIELGRIGLDAPPRVAPKASRQRVANDEASGKTKRQSQSMPGDAPALRRPPGPSDDPNKGRFGGKAESDGFSVVARFDQTKSEHFAPLTLSVEGKRSGLPVNGAPVLFCLHPSFYPQWVKTTFRGQRASITLKTWGGFTLGVWLPQQKVELECDLSQLPDAPKIVRER
jgi:hypothetical protein